MPSTLAVNPLARWRRIERPLGLVWVLLKQVLWRLPMLVLISLIVFLILRVIPVDPTAMLLPPGASDADAARLSRELGLDQPVPAQFMIWLERAFQGDLGLSIQNGQPVTPMVLRSLPMTLELLCFGMLAGVALGLVSGLAAFSLRGTLAEKAILTVTGLMIAIPDFLWAIILIVTLGVAMAWLPFIGPIGPGFDVERVTGFLTLDTLLAGDFAAFGSVLAHLVLPASALGLCIATPIARIVHSSLLEVYTEDYILAARLRGVPEWKLLMGHALRNASLPTVSLIGVQSSVIIGGTLLIESIFGLPGIGNLMLRAITSYDLQVIQALALTYAVTVQFVNVMTEIALYRLNPRLRATP
ncbi:ABC transporter permease [Marinobacter sp. JSM 1782161]|uniref:ABC transporter permease n=1 Tax=Marinobacter sp. JSM 1782161 TaxID=2685906 RepID=UPI001402EE80|nr:ABC transporter permease [Marinobacter sp. JSM 1782161]